MQMHQMACSQHSTLVALLGWGGGQNMRLIFRVEGWGCITFVLVRQPKEEISEQISSEHPGVLRADVQAQQFRSGPRSCGRTSTLVRTYMT